MCVCVYRSVKTGMSTCISISYGIHFDCIFSTCVTMALAQDEAAATMKGWEETRCPRMTLWLGRTSHTLCLGLSKIHRRRGGFD